MTARYAVYFLPDADSRLADFGARWLGWDVHRSEPVPLRLIDGIDEKMHRAVVEAPSAYGFHATLKAPITLTPGIKPEPFLEAVMSLAARRSKISDLRLAPRRIGRFLALTLAQPDPAVGELAGLCVRELDRFRAPLTASDRERRRPDSLTGNQRALLDRWGYPFVFEEFRFHMTLTGPLDSDVGDEMMGALNAAMMPVLRQPLAIDALSVVVQDLPGMPFRLLERFPLRG